MILAGAHSVSVFVNALPVVAALIFHDAIFAFVTAVLAERVETAACIVMVPVAVVPITEEFLALWRWTRKR